VVSDDDDVDNVCRLYLLLCFNVFYSVVNFNFHDTRCLEGSATCMILNLFCALWYPCNSLSLQQQTLMILVHTSYRALISTQEILYGYLCTINC